MDTQNNIKLYIENDEKCYHFLYEIGGQPFSKAIGSLCCDLINISGEDLIDCIPSKPIKSSSLFIQEFIKAVKEKFDMPFSQVIAMVIANPFCMIVDDKISPEQVRYDMIQKGICKFDADEIEKLAPRFNNDLDVNDYVKLTKTLIGLYDIETFLVFYMKEASKYNDENHLNEFAFIMEGLLLQQKMSICIIPNTKDNNYVELYTIDNIKSLVLLEIMNMFKYNISMRTCKNCGKEFIPAVKSNEIYCNNIYKNGKTCKQLGYENKVNSDDVLRTYRTIYKTQNARKQRNKHIVDINERFKQWTNNAKMVLDKCRHGDITVEEMKESLSGTDWITNN